MLNEICPVLIRFPFWSYHIILAVNVLGGFFLEWAGFGREIVDPIGQEILMVMSAEKKSCFRGRASDLILIKYFEDRS